MAIWSVIFQNKALTLQTKGKKDLYNKINSFQYGKL